MLLGGCAVLKLSLFAVSQISFWRSAITEHTQEESQNSFIK